MWPARLLYFIATLCAGGTRWQLSSFNGKYGASLVFSISLHRSRTLSIPLYITLSPHNFVLSPSSLFFAFFLWLPSVHLPCIFLSAAYLCRPFWCSFFFLFTSMSLSFAFGHFLYLLYRFLIVLLLSHSSLPITGHLFDVKWTRSFKGLGSVRHFNVTERSLTKAVFI